VVSYPCPRRIALRLAGFSIWGDSLCTRRDQRYAQHTRRWAHEEHSAGNDPGRDRIRQRLLSSRFRPKLDRRSQKTEYYRRPGEAKFHWRAGQTNCPRRPGKTSARWLPGEATLTRRSRQQANVGRYRSITIPEVPCTLCCKSSALSRRLKGGGDRPGPLHPNAAGEDGLGEFGGRPNEGSAGPEQHELDAAQIWQAVIGWDLGKARRDQLARENRDA